MSPDDRQDRFERGRPARTVTELAVELTIAWLKRVEGTADGRDPKEVAQALDEFFGAVHRNHQRETDTARQPQPAEAR